MDREQDDELPEPCSICDGAGCTFCRDEQSSINEWDDAPEMFDGRL